MSQIRFGLVDGLLMTCGSGSAHKNSFNCLLGEGISQMKQSVMIAEPHAIPKTSISCWMMHIVMKNITLSVKEHQLMKKIAVL